MGRRFHSWIGLAATLLFFLSLAAAAESAIVYVKPGGSNANSGLTWALAKATVTAALTIAVSGDEIWVAAGTYAERITMKSGVALYGGFAGTETARGQRDWRLHVTTLNGGNGGTVVTVTGGAGVTTRLDGFAVTGGRSDYGGGISISGSSPTISNNVIKLNLAIVSGGGIFCSNASPTIIGNSILSNFSVQHGGGIACWRNSSPVIANNRIIGNASNYADGDSFTTVGGGGIFTTAADLDGSPNENYIASPTIVNNMIAANGGDNGAGIRVNDLNSGTATITNNTIVANSGVGLYWQKEFSNTTVVITNNIVAFNAWGLQQRGATSFQIRYNDVFGNSLFQDRTDYIALSDQTGVNGNLSVDPRLVNYKFGKLRLQPDSPCRDAGLSAAVGGGWTDIDGQARVMGSAVDMGADESDGTLWGAAPPVIHVKPTGNDSFDGLTWDTAKKTLSAAIFTAPSSGWEVWVAEGTYFEHIPLAPFVYLYGGFHGDETNRDSRNITGNTTIIDGGGTKTIVSSQNTGYLVSALDGFTIQNGGVYTGGEGTNPNGPGGYGGGIYINVSSPLIAHNVIRWNSLHLDGSLMKADGGGVFSRLSYSIISNNTITENEILDYQAGRGAGIHCSLSGIMIRDNAIVQNHSRYGSAIHCMASFPYILNNLIENNSMYNTSPLPLYTGSATGAIDLQSSLGFIVEGNLIRQNTAQEGAGITVTAASAAGSILNNVITGNAAVNVMTGLLGMGGGIYWEALTSTDTCSLVNNTITGNRAGSAYGSVTLDLSPGNNMIVANNIIANNWSGIYSRIYTPHAVSSNDVFNNTLNYIGLPVGTNDISVDPGFVNGPAGDFHLNAASPCRDKGANSGVPLHVTEDIEGQPRFMDGDLNGTFVVDMGAYEYPGLSDTAPPTGSIVINSGNTYTNSRTVSLALTAADQGTPIQMCLSDTTGPFCPGAWEPFVATRSWTLPPGDGTKTVYIWFKDRFGNMNASPYSDSIILDTVAPTGSIVILSSSAVYTNSLTVPLTLTAVDANTVQMCLSSTPSCSTWEDFSSQKNWTLPSGDGPKTVYVRYRDGAGNVSDQYSDTITLDATRPLDGTATSTPANGQITVAWSGFVDGLSGISNYKTMFDTAATPPDCNGGTMIYLGGGTSFVHTPLTNGITYYYRLCAIDNAGNLSSGVPVTATPHADVILLVSGVPAGDFASLQAAYDAVHENGDVIKARAVNLAGNVVLDKPLAIHLRGGYDPAYTANLTFTTIQGTMTIVNGTVTVEGIAVR